MGDGTVEVWGPFKGTGHTIKMDLVKKWVTKPVKPGLDLTYPVIDGEMENGHSHWG